MPKLSTLSAGLLIAGIPLTSHAALIVGWETWASGNEVASVVNGDATGLGQEVVGDWRESSASSSNDGTFGTLAGATTSTGAASSGTYIGNSQTAGSYDFTVTAGVNSLILEDFHFDARRKRGNSAPNYTVTVVAGDITLGLVGSGSLGNALNGSGPTNHNDFDIDLTSLADHVLTPGESATFRLAFTGGTPTNNDQHTYLDNVAISGSIVPEPGSLALLGFGGLLIARRRKG